MSSQNIHELDNTLTPLFSIQQQIYSKDTSAHIIGMFGYRTRAPRQIVHGPTVTICGHFCGALLRLEYMMTDHAHALWLGVPSDRRLPYLYSNPTFGY